MGDSLKVVELFAGIGTQRMALKVLDIKHKVVAMSEIDKYAIQSYNLIHGETPNLGDVSKIVPSEVPDCDLLTYSFLARIVQCREIKRVCKKVQEQLLVCYGIVKVSLKLRSQSIC